MGEKVKLREMKELAQATQSASLKLSIELKTCLMAMKGHLSGNGCPEFDTQLC